MKSRRYFGLKFFLSSSSLQWCGCSSPETLSPEMRMYSMDLYCFVVGICAIAVLSILSNLANLLNALKSLKLLTDTV